MKSVLSAIVILGFTFLTFAGDSLDAELPPKAEQSDGAAGSEIRNIQWIVRDTTVVLSVEFSQLPFKYLVYALEKSDRIVFDCFDTRIAAGLKESETPPPVNYSKYKQEKLEGTMEIARIILFADKAIPYEVEETSSGVRIHIQWNSKLEEQKAEKAKRNKKRLAYLMTGTLGVAGVTLGILMLRGSSGGNGEEEDIPFPDIKPPDQ
jgi:hypothetical protein